MPDKCRVNVSADLPRHKLLLNSQVYEELVSLIQKKEGLALKTQAEDWLNYFYDVYKRNDYLLLILGGNQKKDSYIDISSL